MTAYEEFHLWVSAQGLTVERYVSVPERTLAKLVQAFDLLRTSLPPRLVSVEEASKVMGVSIATAKRRVKDGSWPCRRDGRRVLVDLVKLQGPSEEEIREAVRVLHGRHD